MIFLFKTHHSIKKGIIQTNDKGSSDGALNLSDLVCKYEIDPCYVVDDTLAGIWPIYKTLSVPLIFGLRINFVNDAQDKSPESNQSAHKNIIFAKNEEGYKKLIKLSTKANIDYLLSEPRIDYNYYHSIKDDSLVLAIPFYDSFLDKNLMQGGQCVPDFRSEKPYVFLENNNLPFDSALRNKAQQFAESNGFETVETQTVYYENPSHALAYQAFRCTDRSGGKHRTMEKPELDHFGSSFFCINR
jgi:DNA polymerase III alpha subunit